MPEEPSQSWPSSQRCPSRWSDRIIAAPNSGDSWCICMWATASLIKQAGCDNVRPGAESGLSASPQRGGPRLLGRSRRLPGGLRFALERSAHATPMPRCLSDAHQKPLRSPRAARVHS